MRTSTRCTRAVDRWRTRLTGIIGLPLLILLFTAFGNNLQAQNSVNVDFSQGSNKNNTLGNIVWINGILQKTNSRIAEGMSTLQRLMITDIQASATEHTVLFKILSNKATFHAYDFVTSWGQALRFTDEILAGIYPAFNGGNYYASPGMNECNDLATGGQSPTDKKFAMDCMQVLKQHPQKPGTFYFR